MGFREGGLYTRTKHRWMVVTCLLAALSWLGAPALNANGDLPSPPAPIPEPSPLRFERISIEDGLSQSSVHALIHDSRGFLWFGTEDGLNKYDGYSFTVYRHVPGDPSSLSHNFVRCIFEDRDGALWIGTNGGGLNRLDRHTGRFTHYRAGSGARGPSSDFIRAIYQDSTGHLWIGTSGNGLDRLDVESGTFERYAPPGMAGMANGWITQIYEDGGGTLWVGSDGGGLARLDRGNGRFVAYRQRAEGAVGQGSNTVSAIHEGRDGRLWVGTDGGGLCLFDRATERFTCYRHDPADTQSLGNDRISAIHQARDGTLWIGTTGGGLDLLEVEGTGKAAQDRFVHYRHDGYDAGSLSSNFVATIVEDAMGMVWVGTHGAGVSVYNPLARPFRLYQARAGDPNSLSNNLVWAIYEDKQSGLWVGTNGGGLDRIDRASGQVAHYRHDPEQATSLADDVVRAIYRDAAGRLWVGMDDGWVDRLDVETGEFAHYRAGAGDPVLALAEDAQGRLWVGTSGSGLYWLDEAGDELRSYRPGFCYQQCLSTPFVRDILVDRDGMLWIGTGGGGLNRFDPESRQFVYYLEDVANPQALGSNLVLAIYQDQAGSLWLGTHGGGLERFDPGRGTFVHYREQDGLANDVVYGIVEDDQGRLWMSTNRGLSRFDPQTGGFTNYDVADGLQSNEFNGGAYFSSESGEIFFGGINGLNAFYPDQVVDNEQAPPVVITALRKFNEVERIDLLPGERIRLRYDENFLSFEFAALDFAAPQQNLYAYQMEKLDREWIMAGTRRHVDYPDLEPGEYVFRVKGSNGDGVWNEEGAAVYVSITPPFWETVWFRGGVVLLLAVGIVTAHRLRVRGIEARSRKLAALVEERTAELRRESEQRLRAEEALRQGEMEKAVAAERSRLARDLHDAVSQTLFSASLIAEALPASWERNTEEGRGLVGELRQLTQGALAEMRTLLLELRPAALVDTELGELVRQLAEAAMAREGLSIGVQVEGRGRLPPEAHIALYRIAQEALNNVLKHARAENAVMTVQFIDLDQGKDDDGRRGQRVELVVEDDGRGFDPDDVRPDCLGLGIMRERATAVGASLEVTNRRGGGTRVTAVWESGGPGAGAETR